ncbi:hypothetical protein BDW72DRAFT_197786 [Aspergillus terricola var. indicus]
MLAPVKELLSRLDLGNFDASAYTNKHSSNIDNIRDIAAALSGGDYRAMINGARALRAFDVRAENASATGYLGGLLQASTYQPASARQGRDLSKLFLDGRNEHHLQILSTYDYWKTISSSTAVDGGANFTWSSIADMDGFKTGQYPMPMVGMDGRDPGEMIIDTNATVYEVTSGSLIVGSDRLRLCAAGVPGHGVRERYHQTRQITLTMLDGRAAVPRPASE